MYIAASYFVNHRLMMSSDHTCLLNFPQMSFIRRGGRPTEAIDGSDRDDNGVCYTCYLTSDQY